MHQFELSFKKFSIFQKEKDNFEINDHKRFSQKSTNNPRTATIVT